MRKVLKMENLDCANCAAKMETAISKIDGVDHVTISFMTQRITLEADESKMPSIIEEAEKACKKVDADCRFVR